MYLSRQANITRRTFAGLGLGAIGALALGGCSGSGVSETSGSDSGTQASDAATATPDSPQTATIFVFDTVVQMSALCSEELMDSLVERCTYFENHFSRTVEGSDVWNVNHAKGKPVEVATETAEVISAALVYSEASGGLFDITIGAVSSLWDFDEGVKPEDDAIQAALPHVDWRGVEVEGNAVTLTDPEAMIDLGGIAKGYIADDLVRMLRDGGCSQASLSLGGNVYVLGQSYDGDPWNVGVQDPNGADNDVIATVEATDASVVTSGLYERDFEQDGVLYYHILDPKTGYPVETDLASASIKSERSLDGDAYSTILFLMGRDAALDLLNTDDRFSGVLVDKDDVAVASDESGFVLA
ncbi:FAD:protein FMN transferase [Paratractidigestivibacter faecalis]|uniref:FAD:protein FMN transferase n=1 Tax=Paratractidigestivibacter faecalis TaxID=2292441 RepID=A0ABV1IGA7_9ACTN